MEMIEMKYQEMDAHLQGIMQQCRRVLTSVAVKPGYTELLSPSRGFEQIAIVRNAATGRVAVFINTVSGYERVFTYDLSGKVLAYVASHFWQTELENWARNTPERPRYANKGDARYNDYRSAQCKMYGTCSHANLDTFNDEAMREAIGDFLGIEIQSRTQLTPFEMRLVELAAEENCFAEDWTVKQHLVLKPMTIAYNAHIFGHSDHAFHVAA